MSGWMESAVYMPDVLAFFEGKFAFSVVLSVPSQSVPVFDIVRGEC